MYGTARKFIDELAEFASLTEAAAPTPRPQAPRRGLPPESLTYPFSLRLTPAEREVVVLASRIAGSAAPATWARKALIEAARAVIAAHTRRPAEPGSEG
jgi:hypothetical protein